MAPDHRPKIWFLLGFSAWLITPYHLLFNLEPTWNMWPGYVKGLELSVVDAIALALLLSGIYRKERIHMKAAFSLYYLVVLSTLAVSAVPEAALLYVWQLSRMALLAVAIAKSCGDPRAPKSILAGLVAGCFYNALFALSGYFQGSIQSGGLIGHQNLIGLMSHFVAFPALALVLGGAREKIFWLGPFAGLIIIVAAASRATFGVAMGAYLALFIVSAMQGWSSRKSVVSAIAVIALLFAAPIAVHSLSKRFQFERVVQSYDERAAFERSAWFMIKDHPFGVGANQYTLAANVEGYSAKGGVAWNSGSRATNVHNIYLLYAAETGWLGSILFILLLVTAELNAFRYAWRRPTDQRAQILLGLGVAVAAAALHSMYEWIMTSSTAQYLLAVDLGLIAGLANQIKKSDAAKVRVRQTDL